MTVCMKCGCRIDADIENEIFPVLKDSCREKDGLGILVKYVKKISKITTNPNLSCSLSLVLPRN